jgi:DNA topoisomerase-1
MEELGIGRPSTYSPTISTIQKREYVIKTDKEGTIRPFVEILLREGNVSRTEKSEKVGVEKGKLFPTDLGTIVNRFLEQYFADIIDYHFTAEVEKVFDEIAEGKAPWNKMIAEFHEGFHQKIEKTSDTAQRFSGERLLGVDPESGRKVFVKIGRYGPMAQIGETDSDDEVRFAGLLKSQSIDSITLDEAMELFRFPREIGEFEGKPMQVAVGRFGPYVKHDNKFFSLSKGDDPLQVTKDRGIDLINAKREKDLANIVKTFDEEPGLVVMNGRFGPYIAFNKKNYKIPKSKDPASLSLEDCQAIISAQSKSKSSKSTTKRKKK